MRLRILDLNTPWFWLTCFYYGKRYAKPSFEISIWQPHKWKSFWIYMFMKEPLPKIDDGGYQTISHSKVAPV